MRLAELRRRQGRFQEAAELLQSSQPHPMAQLGLAALALDQGDPAVASSAAERFLRQLPSGDLAGRAEGLELLVHSRTAGGELDAARTALAEFEEIANHMGTVPFKAAVFLARATVLLAGGDDHQARRWAEDAVDLYGRAGAPLESARARKVLALALLAGGERQLGEQEMRAAARAFDHLGAAGEAAGAPMMLERPAASHSLSPREVQVLALVAAGMTNAQIAAQLVLSPHTVHRHVANILVKLQAPNRAAAIVRARDLELL